MFCMECGKPLPDGAKFCAYCGTRQSPLPSESLAVDAGRVPVMGCSEKQGNLVYAPGWGAYFLKDDNLFFCAEQNHKLRQLTRTREGTLSGLNYWKNQVFFWRDSEQGCELFAVQTGTHEKRKVRLQPMVGNDGGPASPDLNNSRFFVRDGLGYGIDWNGTRLFIVSLETGAFFYRPLPDMRTKEIPENWSNWEFFDRTMMADPDNQGTFNYGEKWYDLYISGGYGYTAVCGLIQLAVRFSLDDPSQFDYLPVNSCCIAAAQGLISECRGGRNVLLGTSPENKAILNFTGFAPDGGLRPWKPAALKLKNSFDIRYWWRCGNRYVFMDHLLDMDAVKGARLPWTLPAYDFAETDSGVYILADSLYFLPANFKDAIHGPEDLERCIVARLEG